MTFKQYLAKFVIGNATISQLPDIAVLGLKEGFESASLLILAGLSPNENSFQIEDYFNRALKELSIELPEKRQAAIQFGIAIIDEVIAGKIDVINGTKRIIDEIIYKDHLFSENKEFCYDGIGFAAAYGLYYTYDDLSVADHQWQIIKSNEELMIEVKKELFEELRKWREKIIDES